MRKKHKHTKIARYIFVFFFFLILILYYFFIILPVVETYSKSEIKALTEKAINLSVSNVINKTLRYESLIDIKYTQTGEISSFSANQHEINSITREIVKETQFQMQSLKEDLKLNIGTFSGIPFFLGKGPEVNLKLVPIGIVGGNFDSKFQSVGINMTKHSLFLYIDVHVSVVMPIKSYEFKTTNQVLLSESVIVGKVPEVYLNGSGLGKNLNLIP